MFFFTVPRSYFLRTDGQMICAEGWIIERNKVTTGR